MSDVADVWTGDGWMCGICEQPTSDRPCPQHQPNRHRTTETERTTR